MTTNQMEAGATSPPAVSIPSKPWSGFSYEPVRGLTDRRISRYLRTQRKNMRRFFTERGLLEFADRMTQIRKSRQGMVAKNQMFQKVLDDYAKLVNPQPVSPTSGETTNPGTEAAPAEAAGSPSLEMQSPGEPAASERGSRLDTDDSVSGVASPDDGIIVIEE
jgi:hypothetical protein